MADTHTATCYCRAIAIEATGAPIDMGYCHCENCRRYSCAPLTALTLWKPENVRITQGAEFLGRFKSSEISDRRYCTKCSSHLIVENPTLGLTDVRADLPTLAFKPTVHLNYEATALPIKDGLPKLKIFPPPLAASGKTLPE